MKDERLAQLRVWLRNGMSIDADAMDDLLSVLDEHAALKAALEGAGEAMELAILNFQRQNESGNFLGDDDHEAWNALAKASPFRNGNILAYREKKGA
jgi:hypothetical protein